MAKDNSNLSSISLLLVNYLQEGQVLRPLIVSRLTVKYFLSTGLALIKSQIQLTTKAIALENVPFMISATFSPIGTSDASLASSHAW